MEKRNPSPTSRRIIVHVTTGLETGGAEEILSRLVQGISGKTYENIVVSLLGKGAHGLDLEKKGVQIYSLNLPKKCRRPKEILLLLNGLWHLIKIIRRYRPVVLHSWMYPADLITGLLGKVLGIPVVWGVFSGKTDRYLYNDRTFRFLKLCGYLAPRLISLAISCSAFGRRTHIELGYPQNRFLYIPTGFPIGETIPLRCQTRDRTSNQTIRVGMLGRITKEKDHRLLLEAIGELVKRGMSIELVLAGGLGISWNNYSLAELIRVNQLTNSTTILGNVPLKSTFYDSVDVFCLISKSEGFPTVVGEAMLNGLPCVASDVGDTRILLGDSRQLVRIGNQEDIMKRILLFLENPELRHTLGKNNYSRIVTLFDEQKMLARYEAAYDSLLNLRTE